jgi:hypothetical protein
MPAAQPHSMGMARGSKQRRQLGRVAVMLLAVLSMAVQSAALATINTEAILAQVVSAASPVDCHRSADPAAVVDHGAAHAAQDGSGAMVVPEEGGSAPADHVRVKHLPCCVQAGAAVLPQLGGAHLAALPAEKLAPRLTLRPDDVLSEGPSKPPRTSHPV